LLSFNKTFIVKEWIIAVIVLAGGVCLIIFLVKQNQKDKKALIQKLNNDYPKPDENDPGIDYRE